ncbi:MAG: diaminopimelate decarboxylase [Firmicutes bacterium]|nr:diaminopimelate decarboxylase [Bacillota bacterium]
MLYSNLKTNDKGHLEFAGVDTIELCKQYGTPLVVFDEQGIRDNCQIYLDAVKQNFGEGSFVAYASKAFSCIRIKQIMKQEGMCLDVSSIGEIFTAQQAGFDMSKVYYHGNFKTEDDIRFAIKSGVGFFMVDNFEELVRLGRIADEMKIRQAVYLRVTPGVNVSTHKAVQTGSNDSKFGVAISTGQAMEFIKDALAIKSIQVQGFHIHIGSQIFEIEPYLRASSILMQFVSDVKAKTTFEAQSLVLGGGFGVRYIEGQSKIDYAEYITQIAKHIRFEVARLGLEMPNIGFEPGRSIIAQNGLTLYKVGSVKEIQGAKNYVVVDGGMNDNPRYALYNSPYTIYVANRMDTKTDFVASIAGRACESGDLVQENVLIPKPTEGDVIAVTVTGAYTYSMASNYNRMTRPCVVLVDKKGARRVIIRKESLEDLIALDNKI